MELNISSPGNRRPRPAEAAEESEAVRGAPDEESVRPARSTAEGGSTGQGSAEMAGRSFRFAPAAIRLRPAPRRRPANAEPSEPAGA